MRMRRARLGSFWAGAVLSVLWVARAEAYVDPGTGALLWQPHPLGREEDPRCLSRAQGAGWLDRSPSAIPAGACSGRRRVAAGLPERPDAAVCGGGPAGRVEQAAERVLEGARPGARATAW